MARYLTFVREPRRLPVVLSQEEIVRLLEAAPGPKYKAAFSAAYGAGLRVSEVVALKVPDVDSGRMLLRIEQGKGQKDRFAMLSPVLLDILRDWYRIARPAVWLFPGRDLLLPLTTRQFNRAVHAAAEMAEINKRVTPHTLRHSFATHLLEQKTDTRLIQVLLGHAKLETTALYEHVATQHDPGGDEPIGSTYTADGKQVRAAGIIRRRSCPALLWKSRTSSATVVPHGAAPMPVT
jgi:site-specific recombinase XerD